MESATAAVAHEHEHHGPPEAHRSSRVEAQLLGMYLFIISEVMLFGAFFTAYFFIRVVAGDPWPAENMHLPVAIAGVNTAIQNALQFYAVDEIVISTFPDERSGWLRGNLLERVRASTSRPVEHVVVTPDELKEGSAA